MAQKWKQWMYYCRVLVTKTKFVENWFDEVLIYTYVLDLSITQCLGLYYIMLKNRIVLLRMKYFYNSSKI